MNAVHFGSSLFTTIGGSRSASQRSPGSPTQISPDAYRTMKPMFSAVASSPARMRSPSFSRSSSSVTTTGCPARIASSAASTDARPNAGAGISFAFMRPTRSEAWWWLPIAGPPSVLASAKVATASIFRWTARYVLGPELGRDKGTASAAPHVTMRYDGKV